MDETTTIREYLDRVADLFDDQYARAACAAVTLLVVAVKILWPAAKVSGRLAGRLLPRGDPLMAAFREALAGPDVKASEKDGLHVLKSDLSELFRFTYHLNSCKQVGEVKSASYFGRDVLGDMTEAEVQRLRWLIAAARRRIDGEAHAAMERDRLNRRRHTAAMLPTARPLRG